MGFFKDLGKTFSKPLQPLAAVLKDVPFVGDYLGATASQEATRDQNSFTQNAAREQMSFSAQQSQKQMDYQTEMSNTAYQRQAADMQKAGLNPITAFGGGASTPSGSAAPGASGQGNAVNTEGILSSAYERARLKKDLKLKDQDLSRMYFDQELKREQTEQIFENRRGIKLENDLLEKRNAYFKDNPYLFKLQAAAGGINSAASMLRLLK